MSITSANSSSMTPSDDGEIESPVSSPAKSWVHGYVKREENIEDSPNHDHEFSHAEYGYQHWHGQAVSGSC